MNWQKPDMDILDQYSNLMRIGYQPDLITLNQLETIDEHVEWKNQKDQAQRDLKNEQKQREELDRIQKERQQEWVKQKNLEKEARESKITMSYVKRAAQKQSKLTLQALQKFNEQSATSEVEMRKQRMVTFDLVSETPSKVSRQPAKLKLNNVDRKLELHDKYFDSPSKMSERSETTATNSYVRSHYTPSPTKMRRDIKDRCNFALSGLNILNNNSTANQKIEFNPMDLSSVGTLSPNFRDRHNGTYSPDVKDRRSRAEFE